VGSDHAVAALLLLLLVIVHAAAPFGLLPCPAVLEKPLERRKTRMGLAVEEAKRLGTVEEV
jgi:hypothetical protein